MIMVTQDVAVKLTMDTQEETELDLQTETVTEDMNGLHLCNFWPTTTIVSAATTATATRACSS